MFINKFLVRLNLYKKIIGDSDLCGLRISRKKYDTRYSRIITWVAGEIKLESLSAHIPELGDVPIQKTPHYDFLSSQFELNSADKKYSLYLSTNFPNDNIESEKKQFVALFNEVSKDKSKIEILIQVNKRGYRIMDGVHRAAILKYLGETSAKCRLIFE